MLSGGMRCVRGSGLVAQDKHVAHGQDVPFSRVFNLPQGSIRTHQPERAFLLALLQKGSPKLRHLRLEAGRRKVVYPCADDLFPAEALTTCRRRRWRPGNCHRRRRSGWVRKGDRQWPGRATQVLSDRSPQANCRLGQQSTSRVPLRPRKLKRPPNLILTSGLERLPHAVHCVWSWNTSGASGPARVACGTLRTQ